MKLKTAEQLWEDYTVAVPVGASATQIRETKRAFLSGIYSLLCELSLVTDADKDALVITYLGALSHDLQAKIAMMILEDTDGVTQ